MGPIEEKAPPGARIWQWTTGPLENNVYLVADQEGNAAIIDPGIDSEQVLGWARQNHFTLAWILITHGHFDHVFRAAFFGRATGAAIAISEADVGLLLHMRDAAAIWGFQGGEAPQHPDRLLKDGDEIQVGSLTLRVVATPGHSPGSVCFLLDGFMFVGDTLFAGSVGRTDLPGSSPEALMSSLRDKLLSLPSETIIYPGHGPASTIAEEKRSNPFLAGQ
jgi:glyoxylase-like metal-dependent hydrolase (beta-lactamase superfamily II)